MTQTPPLNQNPEQLARDRIDAQLCQAGWVVQAKNKINLHAAQPKARGRKAKGSA